MWNDVDYANLAKGFDVHGEGPITDPKDLGPAIKRAIAGFNAASRR